FHLKVAFETCWLAANSPPDPGLKAQSLRVRHDSTKFLEKSILPEISSLPDHRMPGTAVITGLNQAVTPGEHLP
ncbi:MAG: hypothetical protein Q7V36_01610, partial [Deltaproteobacteria bacterium]|nr:hypothetical protein [Deltaproteobacteria bacterium]